MRCLLIFLCSSILSFSAWADYQLTPKKIAENTWLLEGSTENFNFENGGNIVNAAFMLKSQAVFVIIIRS